VGTDTIRTRMDLRRVLVATDQKVIAHTIELTLDHGAFATRTAEDVHLALAIQTEWRPQIVLLDMDMSSDMPVERFLDPATGVASTPVLALTRRGDLKTKLAAFERGVDDFLTIPFCPEELLARVLAIIRRAYGRIPPVSPTLKVGDLQIDIVNRRVTVGSSELHLTALEISLLYLLAANRGVTLSRDQIMDAIWGVDFVSESNVVDRHIRALRAKLMDGWRKPRYIATVPGIGYRFLPTD